MRHPLTRLMFAVACAVMTVAFATVRKSLIVMGVELLVAAWLGVAGPFLMAMLRGLGPIALSTGLMNWAFNDAASGLEFAVRVLAALGGMVMLLVTTPPQDLALGLEQKGLPTPLAYLMAASYQLVPGMARRLQRIRTALKARAVRFDGPWWERAVVTTSLAVPVIVCELLAAEQRAATLMVRGFGLPGKKTSWRELPEARVEFLLRWGLAAMMVYEMVLVVLYARA